MKATSTVEYSFGQVMHFSLAASGPAPITNVTLFIQAPELPNTMTADILVSPEKEINVTRAVDLTLLQLAPFTKVTYWWSMQDETGNRIETERQSIDYVDDQFSWQKQTHDGIEIYWSSDNQTIGQAAQDAVLEALSRIETIFPIPRPEPLRVFVYPSAADLRAGLRLTGRDWVGAHAHPELGVIVVTANEPSTVADDLSRSIPHELAHLFLYEVTGIGYERAPLWFDEGVATLVEGVPNPNYAARLEEAVANGETLAFSDLCYAIPTDADQALLAYAQSAALISYIQTEYGDGMLRRMIGEIADGADCQAVVLRTLGISLAELNQEWLEYEMPQSVFQRVWQNGRAWLVILAAGFLLVGFLAALPKGRNR